MAPKCPGFEMLPQEKYCPWCGAAREEFLIAIEEKSNGSWREVPWTISEDVLRSGIRLKITCNSAQDSFICDLDQADLQFSENWLKLKEAQDPKLLFVPQEVRHVELTCSLPPLRAPKCQATFKARFSRRIIGSAVSSSNIIDCSRTMVVLGKTKLFAEPFQAVCVRNEDGSIDVPFRLASYCGETRILSLSPKQTDDCIYNYGFGTYRDPKALNQLPVQLPCHTGLENSYYLFATYRVSPTHGASLGTKAELQFNVRYERYSQGQVYTNTETVTLSCTIMGIPQAELDCCPRSSPFEWKLTLNNLSRSSHAIKLRNSAPPSSPLTLLDWRVVLEETPDGSPVRDRQSIPCIPPLRLNCHESLPLTLDGGQTASLTLAPNPESDQLTKEGTYVCSLELLYSDGAQRHRTKKFFVRLHLCQAGVFPGALVIDLGTSSSCAAIIGVKDYVPILLPLDTYNKRDPHCLLSILQYRSYQPHHQDYAAGYLPSMASQDYPQTCIASPKRYLGTSKQFEIILTGSDGIGSLQTAAISPQEAVEHLYHCLANAVTGYIAEGKMAGADSSAYIFRRIVLSHPSRFSLRQIEILKQAASNAFTRYYGIKPEELSIDLVPEPTAAAISYLSDETTFSYWHQSFAKDDIRFTILVYDCGGGTTDISLLEIESTRHPAKAQHPEPQQLVDILTFTPTKWSRYAQQALASLYPQDASDEAKRQWRDRFCRTEWVYQKDSACAGCPFTYAELSQAIIAKAVEDWRQPWQYVVRARLLGATGDPAFGGEFMTDKLCEALIAKMKRALQRPEYKGWQVPLSDEDRVQSSAIPAHELRKNHQIIRYLAERAKCSLKGSQDNWQFAFPSDSAELQREGDPYASRKLTLFPMTSSSTGPLQTREEHLFDILQGDVPVYDEFCLTLGTSLNLSLKSCHDLLEECQVTKLCPDVLLLTGQASRWPQISETLGQHFGQARLVHYLQGKLGDELKHCVVEGAAHWRAIQSDTGIIKGIPGVFLRIDGSVNAASSSLGILSLASGQQTFQAIIRAGRPFDSDGCARGQLTYTFPESGGIWWQIYENTGNAVVLNGDDQFIHKVGNFRLEIPATVAGREVKVTLLLNASSQLALELQCQEQNWSYRTDWQAAELGTKY